MCRATAGPLLAIVGVAGTAAGVAIAIVRERVDRRADARAARQAATKKAAEGQDATDIGEDESGVTGVHPVESDADESK